MNYTITKNAQFNSLEIAFDGKPSDEIRNALKSLKFRWHNAKKVWYGYAEKDAVEEAINAAAAPLVIPESTFVDGGGLYDGWAGGNARTWHTDKELKAFLMADFKKAGIAASVRFGRGGYLTSLTVTIKISASDIKSFEDWKAENNDRIFWGSFPWIDYVDEFGTVKTIHREEAYNMKGEEGEKVREACRKCTYEYMVKKLTNSGSTPDPEVLSKAAAAKLDTVKAIVGSYNRDCSNGMIDYFDRDIYDSYTFKVA